MIKYDDSITYSDNDGFREIFIPEEYEKIGDNAFKNCTALETVVMADNVTEIGKSAFENCHSLREIKVSGKLKKLGAGAFKNCDRLKELTLPVDVTFDGVKSVSEIIPTGNYCNLYFDAVLTARQAEKVKEHCRRMRDGLLLADKTALEICGLNCIKELNIPVHIDERIGTLFFVDHPATDVDPFIRRKNISWENATPHCSEEQGILKKVKEPCENYYSAGDEQAWMVHQLSRDMNRLPSFLNNRFYELCLCLPEFSGSEDNVSEDNVSCRISVLRTHAFFLSARKVMFKGRAYYIHSRNYLLGQLVPRYTAAGVGDGIYDRKDMAVFDENGIIEDRELAERIYAKYKLFSIL